MLATKNKVKEIWKMALIVTLNGLCMLTGIYYILMALNDLGFIQWLINLV